MEREVPMATKQTTEPAGPIRDLVVEAARTQLAAVSAGIKFWGAWIEFRRSIHQGGRRRARPARE